MVLKLPKIVLFLHFFANFSKKSTAVLGIYVYASENCRFSLLEIGFG